MGDVAALPDPGKLIALADWLDLKYPEEMGTGEVQADLRLWAYHAAQALGLKTIERPLVQTTDEKIDALKAALSAARAALSTVQAERDALAVALAEMRKSIQSLSDHVGEPIPLGATSVPAWLLAEVIRTLRLGPSRGAQIITAARIAAGALMLVRSADSLRSKDQIALDALGAFMRVSGFERGSVTSDEAREALNAAEAAR